MEDITLTDIIRAFSLTLLAGLATGVGSIMAFFIKERKTWFLSFGLGFSAGVMIYVSFVEILVKAEESLKATSIGKMAGWTTLGAFVVGIIITALIDKFIPEDVNPHDVRSEESMKPLKAGDKDANLIKSLQRTGLFTALAIGIHNFPEGLATFAAALKEPALGVSIAIAIAIHNIPEGISVSLPIYYATGNRKKAFIYSLLSGLAEPVGALVGYFLLWAFFSDMVFGLLFGAVAGVMVYISFDEMLPTAREYGQGHTVIIGLTLGMVVMGASLLLL
jgi:ZIP family zinc transporter